MEISWSKSGSSRVRFAKVEVTSSIEAPTSIMEVSPSGSLALVSFDAGKLRFCLRFTYWGFLKTPYFLLANRWVCAIVVDEYCFEGYWEGGKGKTARLILLTEP